MVKVAGIFLMLIGESIIWLATESITLLATTIVNKCSELTYQYSG